MKLDYIDLLLRQTHEINLILKEEGDHLQGNTFVRIAQVNIAICEAIRLETDRGYFRRIWDAIRGEG